MKRFNTTRGWGRCKHHYCGDCATRRGNRRGNRNVRHAAKIALRSKVWYAS